MTESFNERLERIVTARRSNLCVGLDPIFLPGERCDDDPDAFKRKLTETVIDATHEVASVFKPNAAFFETTAEGSGWIPAKIRERDEEIIVLCDAKRGDIGSTSEAYAEAILSAQGYDAVTVNPLMGHDAVEPFLRRPECGAFLLCLTSNPGADDFLVKGDLYLHIAEKAAAWNRHGNVGLVVGATRPEQAARVRAVAPDLPLLIPGVGAQGGSIGEIIDAIGGRTNRRFIINASRSIMFAKRQGNETQPDACRRAATALRNEINTAFT